ncbi:MAG: hypothetical protein ACJ8F3_14270 [Xanthobacteraceae bacterium]
MVSVQRRFNSTGRARIPRSRVDIRLEEALERGAVPVAFATIDLDGLTLPPTASVELEAYFRSSAMRFRCGTVDALAVPQSMPLTDIDRGGAVRFRLLVIEPSGRILAAADGLRPAVDRDSPDRQPLLPLREIDLGDQLWRVEVDYHAGPTLLINGTVPGLAARLREQALLQGLILPHAFRLILQELASGAGDEEDDVWRKDWRTFLYSLDLPVEPDDPDDQEAVGDWIERAVDVFCAQKKFARRVKLETQQTDDDRA